MRKLLVINPNSSHKMTADIKSTVEKCTPRDTKIDVVCLENSPEVLESFIDYTLAGANVIEYIRKNKVESKYDGILLACFGDPGLYALKELLNIPVLGIAEAAISASLLLGFKYSIVAAVSKARAMMESLVKSYGLEGRLASVEALDVDICTFIEQEQLLYDAALSCGHQAIAKGAEVLILGCAGMTILDKKIAKELGIPVVDPVSAGLHMLSSIIDSGLYTSKIGLYQ